MGDVETRSYPIEQLQEFSVRVFEHFDVPPEDARLAAEVLATSDLRGIDSHGVAPNGCPKSTPGTPSPTG